MQHWMRNVGITTAIGLGLLLSSAWSINPSGQKKPAPKAAAKDASGVPRYEWDPTWPKQPFPDAWETGGGMGVAVDAKDHIWFLHRAKDLSAFESAAGAVPPRAICCKPAPAVIEFDQAGTVVSSWGGPGPGYEWPSSEHGLTIDHKGNFWIGASEGKDAQILKFTRDGKFLLQLGKSGQSKGNSDTANLKGAADTAVDPATNEVWVADGYGNRRVIVYDADTGAYKRHFGAYGNKPEDGPAQRYTPNAGMPMPTQFALVHCVKFSNDGLVYVCDRVHDRIQVFRKDGTFVKEKIVTPDVVGAVANDIAFSPDKEQRFMYVTDHASSKVWILPREDMSVVGSFGYGGHFGGGFTIVHNIAADSKGNLYVTEGLEGKRVQRFLYKGLK